MNCIREHTFRAAIAVVLAVIGIGVFFPRGGAAVPGDLRKTIVLPPAPNGSMNCSVAIDCEGYLYYTNRGVDTLYKIDQDGNLQYKVRTTDQQSGASVYLNCLDWDESNEVMWAGGVYIPGGHCTAPFLFTLSDPSNGISEKQFQMSVPG